MAALPFDPGVPFTPESISKEQAELLLDVIDNWLEGLSTAEAATISDQTITRVSELLELTSGYRDQVELLLPIRERLQQHVSA